MLCFFSYVHIKIERSVYGTHAEHSTRHRQSPGRAAAQPGAPPLPVGPRQPPPGTAVPTDRDQHFPPCSRRGWGTCSPGPGWCRCARGTWNCPFHGYNIGAHPSEQFPGWELLSPVWGNLGGIMGGPPALPAAEPTALTPFFLAHPKPHSHSPAPAWPPFPPSPILFSSSSGVFTSSPGRRNVFPPPHPQPQGTELPSPGPALQPLPGSPGSPGTPIPARDALSPARGEIGVCTHPLPAAAVALSLETGTDSGSITFSALSLSGNFCSNPSEKGGQAGLWVHPSQELCSLPL